MSYIKQRISYNKKKANDFEWARNYIGSIATNHSPVSDDNVKDYNRKVTNYKLYNNELDQKDFEYECSLLNISATEFTDIVQPYIWAYNVINVLVGENDNRAFNHKAVITNSEGVNSFNREQNKLQKEYLKSKILTEIEAVKLEFMEMNPPQLTGDPEQDAQIEEEYKKALEQQLAKATEDGEILNPEQIKKYMSSWRDQREILANELLIYYKKALKIKPKKSDGFKHGQIAGNEAVWVGIETGIPEVKVLNPLGLIYHKSPEVKFIQDGEYAGYTEWITTSDALNRLSPYMTKEQVEKIETFGSNQSDGYGKDVSMMGKESNYKNEPFEMRFFNNNTSADSHGSYGQGNYGELIQVTHVEWVSQKKVFFISYVDDQGEEQEEILSEEFSMPKQRTSETVTKDKKKITYYYFNHEAFGEVKACIKWIPEVWEGTRVDQDIFINIGPKKYQYRGIDNPWKVKLGYHGVVYNNMNASSVSTMDRMKPYQYLYLIVMHKMKQMIALDKPPVMDIDVDEIPDNIDKKEFLHFMDTAGIKFTQRLKHADNPAAANLMATTKSGTSNRSTLNFITNYYTVLNLLKNDIMMAAGVNPERLGQTSNSQSVTGMQQNITQTSHITDYQFKVHNLLWSEILNTLVELTISYLRKNDKSLVKRFALSDGSIANLDFDPTEYSNLDIGVFISDSGKEHEIFDHLKNMTQSLIQNDKINLSILKKMLTSESLEQLDQYIDEYEMNQNDKAMQSQKMQEEHQAKMQEMELEAREDRQAHEVELKRMDIEARVYDSQMDALKFSEGVSAESVHGFVDKEQERVANYEMDRENRDRDVSEKDKDRQLKREEIVSKEKIEKEKNITALKNKVSGEGK